METDSSAISAIDEAYKFLQAVPNPDGSLTRSQFFPSVSPTPQLIAGSPSGNQLALSKDVPLNMKNQTFLRLFRPTNHTDRLPIIIDFHGGGFVICSAASAPFHKILNRASAFAPALVISVDYRLAPEHHLPAAYDDAMEAIMWELADYSNVYIMGTSAGGNIAYHASLRALDADISPVEIKGLILNQPFFGGVQRTQSEDRLSTNLALPLNVSDLMWQLALPLGSDRDHEYCNPLISCSPKIEQLTRCLMRGFEGDPLVDRIKGLVKMLEVSGVHVVAKIQAGGFHGAELSGDQTATTLFNNCTATETDFSAVQRNTMETESSAINEAYKHLKAVPNPDGSLTRSEIFPSVPPTLQLQANSPSETQLALSKDIHLHNSNITFLRLFRPANHAAKLPVIIDFHGSGFVVCSAASAPFHEMWTYGSAFVPALIISVEYRLAPEHRLPAAYDDAMEAVMWVRDQAREVNGRDPWMEELADYSNVYIMGASAGGNIAYHANLSALDADISPVQIKGIILNQPFFGGVQRTQSEERLSTNPSLPLNVSDLMWQLALPLGSDRDHEYSNPLIKCNPKIKQLTRCLIRGFEGDPLVDRIKGLVKMLEASGVHVVAKIQDGGFHGADVFDESKMKELFSQIKDFIYA
uniref:Alpha/beta hydrolase fold-3 domain-containing protein n=2 Tax=Daucus carota subsp. sativus TaxID=79200 RepID=A0A164TW22_DAUCS